MTYFTDCSKCDAPCCNDAAYGYLGGFVRMSLQSFSDVAAGLKMKLEDFASQYLSDVPGTNELKQLNLDANGFCVFFDQKNRLCSIHDSGKPKVCREYGTEEPCEFHPENSTEI